MNRSSSNVPSPTDPRSTPSLLLPSIPPSHFVPATTDVWVNGLWFTSLFLSLTTALVAVLVKQWLHHYVALPSGTSRDRSFTRQFRYAGFQKWHVQVVIGLLPVLMHLAPRDISCWLGDLLTTPSESSVVDHMRGNHSYLHCLCGSNYSSHSFPSMPLPYTSLRSCLHFFPSIVPQVTWYSKEKFLLACRQGNFSDTFHHLPQIQARNQQSLAVIESEFVKQVSTNLAAEALDWLFSVSSNSTVQSKVIQSIGSLPMTSEERFRALQPRISIRNEAMDTLRRSLLSSCLQTKDVDLVEPVPGMERRLERLLRFYRHYVNPSPHWRSRISSSIDSFDLAVTITFNDTLLKQDGNTIVSPGALLVNSISGPCRLPPRCWFHLVECAIQKILIWILSFLIPWILVMIITPICFPLHLCSAILRSLHTHGRRVLTQDFNSPLVLDFKDALPYFLDKISDSVLAMFSKFVEDPPLSESLPQSLRMFVAAIKFLLHRLSRPDSGMSHTIILESLFDAVLYITDGCRQTCPSPGDYCCHNGA